MTAMPPAASAPLVSVCIGSYNRERYIGETLDSVFAQTYSNLEIIVIDDASTDRTVDIVRSYGDRVRLVQRAQNSGICPVTRNQACRMATGQYIALLDSDDSWLPGKIAAQVAFLEAHPAMPLCHTYCERIDEASRSLGIRHEGVLPPTGPYFDRLLEHCWITISSVMMRRSLYEEIGPFNEHEPYGRLGEDYEYFLRVSRRYDIGLVNEVLCRYRVSTAGITHGQWQAKPRPLPFYEAVLHDRHLWEGRIPRARMKEIVMRCALENAAYWRHHGFSNRALWLGAQAVRHAPASASAWSDLCRSLWRKACPARKAAVPPGVIR